jgi:hypothetical protein
MKCPKCQAENPDTARYCLDCGTQLIRGHEPKSPEFDFASSVSKTETLQAPIQELTTGSTFAGRGGASHLLRGIVTRSGDSFRIQATLQETANLAEIAGTYSADGIGEGSFLA